MPTLFDQVIVGAHDVGFILDRAAYIEPRRLSLFDRLAQHGARGHRTKFAACGVNHVADHGRELRAPGLVDRRIKVGHRKQVREPILEGAELRFHHVVLRGQAIKDGAIGIAKIAETLAGLRDLPAQHPVHVGNLDLDIFHASLGHLVDQRFCPRRIIHHFNLGHLTSLPPVECLIDHPNSSRFRAVPFCAEAWILAPIYSAACICALPSGSVRRATLQNAARRIRFHY